MKYEDELLGEDFGIRFPHVPWSEDDIKIVKKFYGIIGNREIQKMLSSERTREAIQQVAYRLGLQRKRKPLWSSYDDNILRKYYKTGGVDTVRKMLDVDRSKQGIYARACKLGLTHSKYDGF